MTFAKPERRRIARGCAGELFEGYLRVESTDASRTRDQPAGS